MEDFPYNNRRKNGKRAVGIVITIFLLLLAYFTVSITCDSPEFNELENPVVIKTTFKNVSGLHEGASVRLEGYFIGFVKAINFPENPESPFIIEMEVGKKYLKYIEANSVVFIKTEGVLGNVLLDIERGDTTKGYIKEGGMLNSSNAKNP